MVESIAASRQEVDEIANKIIRKPSKLGVVTRTHKNKLECIYIKILAVIYKETKKKNNNQIWQQRNVFSI